ASLLRLSCDKANALLGWHSVLDAHQAVRMTAAWYRDTLFCGASARERCMADIEEYVSAACATGQWWAR
ncbi:MAG: CDP-glucose 4,6-dehydratase, partial [Coriobacteriia bacterium]|nr:CDP-glucose 4,6-dehydratase [Coriobacteriia bacterium]